MHGRSHAHRCTYSNMPVTVVGDVPVIPYTNQIVKVASDLSLVIHVVEVCQWGHSQSDQAGSDSEPGHKKHKKHKTSYDASGRKVFHLYQTIHGRLLAKEWARIRELCVDFLTASTVMPNPICQMKLVDEYRRDGYRIISTSTYSIAPLFFQNGDKSEFEMCFAPSWGEGGGGGVGVQNTSRIQNKEIQIPLHLCLLFRYQVLLDIASLPGICSETYTKSHISPRPFSDWREKILI